VTAIEPSLLELSEVDDQIARFVATEELAVTSPISLSVDAMAMAKDQQYLTGKNTDYAFVRYAQSLDRRLKCFPHHVKPRSSGQANNEVQIAIDSICQSLTHHGIVPKYICTDGDAGYNGRHQEFFAAWYPIFLERGLEGALRFVDEAKMLPVTDYLHLWKNFCNKIKNHPVALRPDSLDSAVDGYYLESKLSLGPAVLDKSAVGRETRMR
jgi:hypothetical protein